MHDHKLPLCGLEYKGVISETLPPAYGPEPQCNQSLVHCGAYNAAHLILVDENEMDSSISILQA